VPEEISGFAAARNTNNTEGAQLSRKEAARLYSIGPVLQHEQLYHLARMQVETHIAATIEEGSSAREGAIRRIDIVDWGLAPLRGSPRRARRRARRLARRARRRDRSPAPRRRAGRATSCDRAARSGRRRRAGAASGSPDGTGAAAGGGALAAPAAASPDAALAGALGDGSSRACRDGRSAAQQTRLTFEADFDRLRELVDQSPNSLYGRRLKWAACFAHEELTRGSDAPRSARAASQCPSARHSLSLSLSRMAVGLSDGSEPPPPAS
jgi:hypothetical protein